MKFKKLSAIMLSVAMTACGCDRCEGRRKAEA